MIASLTLLTLLTQCAPQVSSTTMRAIVRVESGTDPLAIGDNTTRRSYHPRNRPEAESIAKKLLAAGHSLDLGIAQVDDMNLEAYGARVDTIFDPCTNLAIGAQILAHDYTRAVARFGPGQIALRHALGAYNTGNLNDGQGYARRVVAAAAVSDETSLQPSQATTTATAPGARRSPTHTKASQSPASSPILITAPTGVVVF